MRLHAPNGATETRAVRRTLRMRGPATVPILHVFVGIACLAPPTGVAAQPALGPARRVLVIRADEASSAAAEALGARLIERSAALGEDVGRPPRPPPATLPGDELAAATLRADEAFASLALAEAERTIEAALAAIDAEGPASQDALVDALLLASMVHDATGDVRGAEEAARRALVVRPTLTIDPTRYPPTLATRVESLRAGLARCAITLRRDEPADATLRLDGAPVDVTTAELPCGTHWVWAEHPGRTAQRRRVTLVEGTDPVVVAFTLPLDPGAALAALGAPGAPVDATAEHAAALLGRSLWVLDVTAAAQGGLRATLGARTVALGPTASLDAIADALLAPVVIDDVDEVAIGVGVGAGSAALVALAIVLGVALAPQGSPGWVGTGEIVVP